MSYRKKMTQNIANAGTEVMYSYSGNLTPLLLP